MSTDRCPRCLSEMILLFRFTHCASKCEVLDSAALSALRRRNYSMQDIDLAWHLPEESKNP